MRYLKLKPNSGFSLVVLDVILLGFTCIQQQTRKVLFKIKCQSVVIFYVNVYRFLQSATSRRWLKHVQSPYRKVDI